MALSLDVVRQVEQDLLLKADVLAYHIGSLVATDAERARSVCDEIVSRLRAAASTDSELEPKSDVLRSLDRERRPNVRLAARSGGGGGDEVEEFILDILAQSSGLSVQEIVDRFQEAEIAIKRATLVVRLHRMVQAGKLTSRTHGHYVLSEAEHNRRQLA
jgi:hypothetical protein